MCRVSVLIFLIFMLANDSFSQLNQCGTDRASEILQSNDTNYFRRTQEVQNIVDNYLKYLKANPNLRIGNADITIPVIVNIVYKNTDENISDAIVQTQIDQLNSDFNKLNDQSNIPASVLPIVGTPNIQFCLQQINRATTTITKFVLPDIGATGGNTQLLPTIISPTNQSTYLNFYIADIGSVGTNGLTRDDIGGFTFLPSSINNLIYIDYTRFGNPGTNGNIAGHIATHEVGHWLGLCHPWTVSGNCISGVPNMPTSHASAYLNCDDNLGTLPTHMNFMEYKYDDNCRTMFTSGQVLIMRAMLSAANPYSTPTPNQLGPLYSMVSATNLDPNRCSIKSCPTLSPLILIGFNFLSQNVIQFTWSRVPNAIGYKFEYKLSTATTWTAVTVAEPSFTLSNLTTGQTYSYRMTPLYVSICSTSPTNTFSITVNDLAYCSQFYFSIHEPNNTISQPLSYSNLIIPNNSTHTITINDNLETDTDEDWFRVKTNAGQSSIRIILEIEKDIRTVGVDYDLEIYDCNGSFITSSNNNKTLLSTPYNAFILFRELITMNNITAQTDYYIRIIDRGIKHTKSCYKITINENNVVFTDY